ncbi:DsbA family protein [Ancylobacter radicis]|uniref:Thioredoxin domain-containing protein n=1 Tax=Ancylobacter radicis TaxID=2836179 RepID=A0ABS5R5P8_9HYPH|nr:thioredoxin domain-containing protein [Ancylobacter radicis]MBS9477003.1 thioredoxin domain-containing protein [Ancylobacter radicis]
MSLTPAVGPHDHSEGLPDAPVTLVEYGDYECPYCGEAYPELKAVQRLMGDRLRFVFRNFPLTEAHPHAAHAAAMAEAAAGIGKFWEMHDMLYEHQGALDDRSLTRYGTIVGLTMGQIEQALSGAHDEVLRRDFMSGLRSGVNGTPALFINGQRYDGSRDADSLVEVLRAVARDVA